MHTTAPFHDFIDGCRVVALAAAVTAILFIPVLIGAVLALVARF